LKALVFGANGQDGEYLVEALRARGLEAIGTSRAGPWERVDVANGGQVDAAVARHRPDFIFQLAARSTTRHDALFENHATISTGALNVLESVSKHVPGARVFIAGSGVQFENTGAPIDEDTPFSATSAYAVARIHSVYAARYYRARGLRTYVGYLFHHESPRRGPGHLSREIAQAALRIAGGGGETLEIGDPTVVKEWTFAGDTVEGILALVTQDEVTEAVIGSGEGHSVQEWLEACFSSVGLAWREHVRIKTGFRAEYPTLLSRPARLLALGWRPRVGFEELAEMMMTAQFRRA
jgi:GDPmannose 4,6-dehydratase